MNSAIAMHSFAMASKYDMPSDDVIRVAEGMMTYMDEVSQVIRFDPDDLTLQRLEIWLHYLEGQICVEIERLVYSYRSRTAILPPEVVFTCMTNLWWFAEALT